MSDDQPSRRELTALLEEAGREASRLEAQLRARNNPVLDSYITDARVEVLLNKLWGPFDPEDMGAASELRALFELDYLAEMNSRMRQALLQLPPPATPPGLHIPYG